MVGPKMPGAVKGSLTPGYAALDCPSPSVVRIGRGK